MKIYTLVLVAFILVGLGCVSQSNTPATVPNGQTVSTNNLGGSDQVGNTGGTDTGTGSNTNTGNVVEVDLKNIEFNPSTLTLSVGQTIHFVNKDGFAHDVHLTHNGTDFFPRVQVNAGSSVDVEITEAGSYDIICDRHAPGMAGHVDAS